MDDPNPLAFAKLPLDLLTLLASRHLHDALQPLHHLIRLAHILAAGGFFGAVGLLDLRLLRARRSLPLAALAGHVHAWLVGSFAIVMATGAVLFAYDPIRVGSHAYFTPKLALLLLALGNAYRLHHGGLAGALASETPSVGARVAGAVSLAAWVGVMICASLNTEAAPRVPLW
jgi:hypothetical protein